jgi:cellulose synthase/poly-beta-1,6-N-acetylglucosamine synthase-like glycosyltransferase
MLQVFSWLTAAVLLLFNLRRLVFLLAAVNDTLRPSGIAASARFTPRARLKPRRRDRNANTGREAASYHVLILTPLRNEVHSLPGLVESLLALDYPVSLLTLGLIDDGSTDGSGRLMDELASTHAHVAVLHNPASLGKAEALNAGLLRWPQGDLVFVYDADARPQPGSLRQIVAAFDDPAVAGAGGLIRPANGLASPAATYGAIERLVHQQVTLRAKDRLDLAPALLGSHCAYRRSDLEAVGGFPGGAYLEDSHLTMAFARRGRRTRFLPGAVAADRVPETLAGYWRQHVRWGRGFHDVALQQAPSLVMDPPEVTSPVRFVLRLELWLFALGYLDRLALLLGGALWIGGRSTRPRPASGKLLAALVGSSLVLPYVQIALALAAERVSVAWWRRLPLVPLFFLVDIAAAVWSAGLSVARRPRLWQQTERRSEESGEWRVESES